MLSGINQYFEVIRKTKIDILAEKKSLSNIKVEVQNK